MFKCIGLVSFETLVLIAALFLFVYTRKNEMSKWLQYIAATVTGFVGVLIIGTIFACMAVCCMGGGRCGGGKWEKKMRGPGCEMNQMQGNDNCCKKGGEMEECNMGMQKEIRIQINEDKLGGKDTVEKKVIIRKN
jgi:hypothetical protein